MVTYDKISKLRPRRNTYMSNFEGKVAVVTGGRERYEGLPQHSDLSQMVHMFSSPVAATAEADGSSRADRRKQRNWYSR